MSQSKYHNATKVKDREVETVYTNVFQFETFRKLTFKERLSIFLGGNIEVSTTCATQWKPGKFRPVVSVKMTKQREPLGGEAAYDGYIGTPTPIEKSLSALGVDTNPGPLEKLRRKHANK